MINSISSHVGTIPNFYQRVESSEKIEVPLPSSISVYAQFKYVRGVPASSGQQPVSLNRAQIIDNMVSYLNGKSGNENLNKNEEYHMRELETEVHRVINEEKPHFTTFSGKSLDSGVIFNLSA